MAIYLKITGENPNVFKKIFGDGTEHELVVWKGGGRSFNAEPRTIAVSWEVSTKSEYDNKVREFKEILSNSIKS